MLVSLDLLVDVEGLEFGQNLDNCLLEFSSDHQSFIVGGCKSLLSDLNSMNWLHSISHLVILSRHELTSRGGILVKQIFKDKNISFLSEINLVKHLDTREPSIQVVMEVLHAVVFSIISKSIQLSDLQQRSK